MIEKAIVDLINREIDGQTTPEESSRLHAILLSDPGARELFDDLRQLVTEMSDVKTIEPPQTLKPSIMRAIDGSNTGSIRQVRRRAVRSWHLVLTFGGGLAAGFLLFMVFSNPQTPRFSDFDLTGTIAQPEFSTSLSPGERVDIQDVAVAGGLESRWGNGICLIHVDLNTSEKSTIRVQFDPAAVRIASVRPSDKSRVDVQFREGEVRIDGDISGPLDLVLAARTSAMPPAEIHIVTAGKTVFSSPMKLQPVVR